MNDKEVKKSLFTKISISVLIVFIFFLWLLNLKNFFGQREQKKNVEWGKIQEGLNRAIEQAKDNTSKIVDNKEADKQGQEFVRDLMERTKGINVTTTTSETLVASSSEAVSEITEQIKQLRDIASSSLLKKNCPEYINCMPSIGEVRSCVVPAGCEKITQIAY